VKIGQVVVFVAALGLLGLYTVSDQLARDEGFHVRITWVSLALLGVAALVVLLPRLTRRAVAPDHVDIDLAGRAHDAALTAATVALGRGAAALEPGEPSPALARATVDPLTSIELSRRVLAAELRRLAAAAGISSAAPSLVGFADRLYGARWLSAAEASAIGELAAVIDAAKASGSVAPGVAQDVDDATQLLVPVLDGRLDEAVARYDRPRGAATARPARGADLRSSPYDELEAIDGSEDLDELDEVDETDDIDDIGDIGDVEIDLREHALAAEGVTASAGDGATGDGATGESGEPIDGDAATGDRSEPRALESPLPEPVTWRSAP
jgi:hypothetical protein